MELLGILFGWILSPFSDSDDEFGRNRYWEDPDYQMYDLSEDEESTDD